MKEGEGLAMLNDVVLIVMFWGLILGPCLLAQKTGLHRGEE